MSSALENNMEQNLSAAINKLTEGDFDNSLFICRNLITAHPEDSQLVAKAHLVAGRAYLFLRQFDASEQELKLGLKLDASQAPGYIDLALICMKRRLHSEAVNYLKQAQECPVTSPKVRLHLVFVLLQARQFGDAYRELNSLLSSTNQDLSRSLLQILKGIAWYGKIRWRYRNLIAAPLFLFLMLPLTRVWAWMLLTLFALGILLVLQRSHFFREVAPTVMFVYAILTSMFLLSLVVF
jgi:tetratricopeptide (TPR) repeat protein